MARLKTIRFDVTGALEHCTESDLNNQFPHSDTRIEVLPIGNGKAEVVRSLRDSDTPRGAGSRRRDHSKGAVDP